MLRWIAFALALAAVVLPGGATARSADVVSVSLTGNGRVTSTPSGIDCPGSCSATFKDGEKVVLRATAASGWTFTGWSGDCSGSSRDCTFKADSKKMSITARFTQIPAPKTLVVQVDGSGAVRSAPEGIDCPSTCSASFAAGTQVTLTPEPADGWSFDGWGGDCSGAGACAVTLDADRTVRATFAKKATSAVVTVHSEGPGSVTSIPERIYCPPACSSPFDLGTKVVLVADPDGDSVFTGWNGACTGKVSCAVTPGATVGASFRRAGYKRTALAISVVGPGRVVSSPAGIACPPRCKGTFDRGSRVSLLAKPASGAKLDRWTGGCSGDGACYVTIGKSRATARFVASPQKPCTPAKLPKPTAAGGRLTTGSFDFEDGLAGWSATGEAFRSQPTYGDNLSTARAAGRKTKLGGTYWNGPYRVGKEGDSWIGSAENRPCETAPWGRTQGDGPTGTLVSPPFLLTKRHVTMLVGGKGAGERVELWVKRPSESAFIHRRELDVPAGGNDVMHPADMDVSRYAGPKTIARVVLVDDSPRGHLNVDRIRLAPLVVPTTPAVWGYADFHTHPMANQGFGGLRGIHTMWGSVGGRYSDYVRNPALVNRDLPQCNRSGHGGGPLSQVVINGIEYRIPRDLSAGGIAISLLFNPLRLFGLARELLFHDAEGAPNFEAWPTFLNGAHNQQHITQIRRSYDGGLRLMSALAVSNPMLEYVMGYVEGPEGDRNKFIRTTPDLDVIQAFVCGMRRLAALNSDWMEIAYTPAQARRIILQNKLAVLLGVEVDQLGQLGIGDPAAEVQRLYELGIRQVTPIHAIDNAIGGAGIFQDVYNTENDYLNRPQRNIWGPDLRDHSERFPARFFGVREGGCHQGPLAGRRGECALYRLSREQNRATIDYNLFPLGGVFHPGAETTRRNEYIFPPDLGYAGPEGQLNTRGLESAGAQYIRAMMSHGMLIDIAHMSDRAADSVFQLTRADVPHRDRDCANFSQGLLTAPDRCYDQAYPVMYSHVAFRAQSLHDDATRILGHTPWGSDIRPDAGTRVRDFLPREFETSASQVELIRRQGGVIGVFAGQDPLEQAPDQDPNEVANDCATSTKGFAQAYLYAVQKMGGRGVGLGTDFGFHSMVSPRFGLKACYGSNFADDPGDERHRYPSQYRFAAQTGRVAYGSSGLTQYRLGARRFDYNTDGLAHYGLVPDMLQDARNVGVTQEQMEPLFFAAEDYVSMWEKAWRVEDCRAGDRRCDFGAVPAGLPCDDVCHGTCPTAFRMPGARID